MSEISKILGKWQFHQGGALLLYELSEREPGWRFTARFHTEPRWIGVTLVPRRFVIMVDIFMFLVILYIRSYWFVTFRSFISYWSLILCEYRLPCFIKPLFSTGLPPFQNVEKMMIFRIFMKIRNKNFWISEFLFEELPLKETLKMDYKWGDLLYEFPAETRLTVYRRLDIPNRGELAWIWTCKVLWFWSTFWCF